MRIDDTKAALESYRDDERFEELSSLLLSQVEPRIRPLGGRGDRARDAVAGLYGIPGGEDLVVMYSLQKAWDLKIANELCRIRSFGWQPKDIIAVTNRALDRDKERVLQGKAEANGWALTIHGQEWLANKLHLRDNLDLRTQYLGLARPEPDLFMLAHDFWALLQERGQPPVGFVGRGRELRAALDRLHTSSTNVLVEADGGLGKTRLVYEMSQADPRERRWFFVPEGLPFQPTRLSELESGDEIVVVVDDAHRRPDLRALLVGLERRVPRPQVVLIVRPGYNDVLERARRGLAFSRPETIRLAPLGRQDLVTLLRQPPFELRREGTLLSIVQLSGGNPQIAIIAGKLAASGKPPHDLRAANVFRDYVDSVLDAAPAVAPEARELLALIAAVRTLSLASASDVADATGITGLDGSGLRRRLAALADSGLIVELSNTMFTIKPDLLSEEILRYSFFDQGHRPTLPYTTLYEAFAPRRQIDLLQALSEARLGAAVAASESLRMVGGQLLADARTARPALLPDYARFASAAAGIPDLSLDLTDALIARLPEMTDSESELVVKELIDAVSRAKFGDFARGFRTLLRLGPIVFADSQVESVAQEALRKEISEVYSSCPVDYSDDDWRVLAGVQAAICEEAEKFWQPDDAREADVVTAALASRALLTLVYEHLRPGAEDATSLRIYNVGVPATQWTRAALKLGAQLYGDTFLRLSGKMQLEQLKSLRHIANTAAGVSGLAGYEPAADMQVLAEETLSEAIEPWLCDHLAAMPLPVAAEVLGYFKSHARPIPTARLRVGARLREYTELIHPNRYAHLRQGWAAEQKADREHGKKYANRLLRANDPLKLIDRWNVWIEEAKHLLDKSPWHQSLPLALAEAGKRDPDRGCVIAKRIFENNLRIAAYGDRLLEAVARLPAGRDMIGGWRDRPQAHLRRAAAIAAVTLDAHESRATLIQLAGDTDITVRAAVWETLFRLPAPLSVWQLQIALELSGDSSAEGRLDLLLVRLAQEANQGEDRAFLADSQKVAIAGLILATARTERIPRYGIGNLLEHASKLGLDLVEAWVWQRIDYLRHSGPNLHMDGLPADLEPVVNARREALSFSRLIALYEDDTLTPWARQAAEQAISWIAGNAPELTAQIVKWSGRAEGLSRTATFLARTTEWEVFTQRARLLLHAHPVSSSMGTLIIDARRPMEFCGSGEPQYRAEAEKFATWLKVDDALLAAIGKRAVEHYNNLADEAAASDEAERQGFDCW